jgi:hypothetical protein
MHMQLLWLACSSKQPMHSVLVSQLSTTSVYICMQLFAYSSDYYAAYSSSTHLIRPRCAALWCTVSTWPYVIVLVAAAGGTSQLEQMAHNLSTLYTIVLCDMIMCC